jgi:hypothetical protein
MHARMDDCVHITASLSSVSRLLTPTTNHLYACRSAMSTSSRLRWISGTLLSLTFSSWIVALGGLGAINWWD